MNSKFEKLSHVQETCFSAFLNGKDEADDSCFLCGWRRIAGVATRPDLSGKWQMERAENLSGCCGCIEPAAICGACNGNNDNNPNLWSLWIWNLDPFRPSGFMQAIGYNFILAKADPAVMGDECAQTKKLSMGVQTLDWHFLELSLCNVVVCMIFALKAASFARVAQPHITMIDATPCYFGCDENELMWVGISVTPRSRRP